jgi:hypothetical protein
MFDAFYNLFHAENKSLTPSLDHHVLTAPLGHPLPWEGAQADSLTWRSLGIKDFFSENFTLL